jgi:Arc/MetJ family transcription regulator
MRTTLNIDDRALGAAMKHARGKTRTAVINEALAEYARHRALAGLLRLRGKVEWQGDLDRLRRRK